LFVLLLLLSSIDPAQTRSLLQAGLLALQQGRLPQARTDLEQAVKQSPQNPYIWVALAQVYLRSGDRPLATSAAATAEKDAGTDPVLFHALSMYYSEAGDAARANALEQKSVSLAEKDAAKSPEAAFRWAQVYLRREEFTPAADLLQAALQSFPNDPQLVLALGVARYGQRRFEDAIVAFLKVIRLDPTVEQPYLFIARILDQAGPHLQEITKDYEHWEAANPNSAKPKLVLAEALLVSDSRSARAEQLLRQSIALDPNDWEAHYQLGLVLANKHQYPQAAAELKRATELNPKEPMPHYHLARVYDRLGQPAQAAAERAIHQQLTATPVQK
jgi:tetratricopeptide (TPR) repeat protein